MKRTQRNDSTACATNDVERPFNCHKQMFVYYHGNNRFCSSRLCVGPLTCSHPHIKKNALTAYECTKIWYKFVSCSTQIPMDILVSSEKKCTHMHADDIIRPTLSKQSQIKCQNSC